MCLKVKLCPVYKPAALLKFGSIQKLVFRISCLSNSMKSYSTFEAVTHVLFSKKMIQKDHKQRHRTPDSNLSVSEIFFIFHLFAYGYVFLFALPDSYITKSASLPGYGRNPLNRVSSQCFLICSVRLCVLVSLMFWEIDSRLETKSRSP